MWLMVQVVEAFKILTADPKVKAILVNIFGEALMDRSLHSLPPPPPPPPRPLRG